MSDIDDGLKGIIQDMEGGTAFNRGLEGTVQGVGSRLSGVAARVPTNLDLMAGHFQSRAADIGNRMTASVTQVNRFGEHITDHFNKLSDNINLFASSQRMENAMSGKAENSCGDMHSFFGSITQEGPSLMDKIRDTVEFAASSFDQVNAIYGELKQQVDFARGGMLQNIERELAVQVDDAKRLVLVDLKGQLEVSFNTMAREGRDALIADAIDAIEDSTRKGEAEKLRDDIRARDDAVEASFLDMDKQASEIDAKQAELGKMMDSEQAKVTNATKRLTTLGAASSMRSLYKSDPCVQTLMGYVGSDSLLGKMG
jgi:hypothetical protein